MVFYALVVGLLQISLGKKFLCEHDDIFLSQKTCLNQFPGLRLNPIALNNWTSHPINTYIVAYNNPTFVANMVRQIDCYNSTAIVLNAGSTFQPLTDYLNAFISCSVRIGKNHSVMDIQTSGMQHLPYIWYQQIFKTQAAPKFAALTDADLQFNRYLPPNFLQVLAYIAVTYSVKAGLALDVSASRSIWPGSYIHRVIKNYTVSYGIREWETQFWSKGREIMVPLTETNVTGYNASIDSTFAVYDLHGVHKCLADPASCGANYMAGIRLANNFTCQHIPWEIDFFKQWDQDEIDAVYFNASGLSSISVLMRKYGYGSTSALIKSKKKSSIYLVQNGTRHEFQNGHIFVGTCRLTNPLREKLTLSPLHALCHITISPYHSKLICMCTCICTPRHGI